jgi:hypothetical protein
MNPANPRELLTAAVDGELTPAERKAAERLLRESESARVLFAKLKQDAARVRNLPKVPAPLDLADGVMGVIRERALSPIPLPPSRKPTPRFNWSMLPVWVNVASAVAVLILISVGSYLYFAASHDYLAEQRRAIAAKAPEKPADATPAVAEKGPAPKVVVPTPGDAVVERPRDVVPEIGPSPRLLEPDLQLGPQHDYPEIQSIQLDKIRLSHFFTLRDLPGDEEARKKMVAELKKDELIRLDLFCQSTPHALDFVLAGLKAKRVSALTDAFAQDRLKRKVPTEVVIFTEALTPDDVAAFLTALGAEDKKASGAGEFDTLVVAPFLPADLDLLARLLGLPAVTPKAPKGKSGIDIRKPLPEGTANQVAQTLSKMGGGTPAPSASKGEKVAVVVAYSPMNPSPGASKEIKHFLDRRGERKPDAKPLMLVLRIR